MSLRLFSRAWQEITKLKKNKLYDKLLNIIFHPFAGGSCSADCSKFLHIGWYPRRNHAYQILSRSLQGLRSYGGPKSGISYSFFKPLLQQCFALPCNTVVRTILQKNHGITMVYHGTTYYTMVWLDGTLLLPWYVIYVPWYILVIPWYTTVLPLCTMVHV